MEFQRYPLWQWALILVGVLVYGAALLYIYGTAHPSRTLLFAIVLLLWLISMLGVYLHLKRIDRNP